VYTRTSSSIRHNLRCSYRAAVPPHQHSHAPAPSAHALALAPLPGVAAAWPSSRPSPSPSRCPPRRQWSCPRPMVALRPGGAAIFMSPPPPPPILCAFAWGITPGICSRAWKSAAHGQATHSAAPTSTSPRPSATASGASAWGGGEAVPSRAPVDGRAYRNSPSKAAWGKAEWWRSNNRAGLTQIAGRVQAADRKSQSKRLAKSRNSGRPCETCVIAIRY
jgi:hypothetical protein